MGAGRTVLDVDKDLDAREAERAAAQASRDRLLSHANAARCAVVVEASRMCRRAACLQHVRACAAIVGTRHTHYSIRSSR